MGKSIISIAMFHRYVNLYQSRNLPWTPPPLVTPRHTSSLPSTAQPRHRRTHLHCRPRESSAHLSPHGRPGWPWLAGISPINGRCYQEDQLQYKYCIAMFDYRRGSPVASIPRVAGHTSYSTSSLCRSVLAVCTCQCPFDSLSLLLAYLVGEIRILVGQRPNVFWLSKVLLRHPNCAGKSYPLRLAEQPGVSR